MAAGAGRFVGVHKNKSVYQKACRVGERAERGWGNIPVSPSEDA